MIAQQLPSTVEDLLQVLVDFPTASPSLEELAEATGLDCETLQDMLANAEADGWVEPWVTPEALMVALSPSAAERLGLRIEEVHSGADNFLYRWVPSRQPEAAVKAQPQARMTPASQLVDEDAAGGYFDAIADPSALEPIEASASLEEMRVKIQERQNAAKTTTKKEPFLLRPTIVLGIRPQWNSTKDDGPCIGCGDRPLALGEYCCRCERAGLDDLLPKLSPKLLRLMAERTQEGDDLAGGTETREKPPGGSFGKRPGANAARKTTAKRKVRERA